MNNKNKILVGCLALLLVLSVGYALFSETITINGTATAKGNFDVTTACSAGIMDEVNLENGQLGFYSDDHGFEEDTCDVTKNVVSFSTNLKYPGATRHFTIKATNTGSIPAKLTSLDYDGLTNISEEACELNSNDEQVSCNYRNKFSNSILIGFQDSDNKFYNIANEADLEQIFVKFSNENHDALIIEPGESIYYVMSFFWSSDDTTNSGHYSFSLSAEIPFEQYSEN